MRPGDGVPAAAPPPTPAPRSVLDATSLEPIQELDLRGAVADLSLSEDGQVLTVAAGSSVHFIRVSDWHTLATRTIQLPGLACAWLPPPAALPPDVRR